MRTRSFSPKAHSVCGGRFSRSRLRPRPRRGPNGDRAGAGERAGDAVESSARRDMGMSHQKQQPAEPPTEAWIEGVTEIVANALAVEGSARLALVDEACADDVHLRREVEALIAEHETGEATIQTAPTAALPPTQPARTSRIKRPITSEPDRIGPYRIVSRLGEGGMGTVYLAEQDEPVERRVALKVIRVLHQNSLRRRFAGECQALARLNHPNIAALYEVGSTELDSSPYVAMEWVDGQPITRWCDMGETSVAARLRLFLGVCAGIKHAHEKNILHCDLKPSNVLVTWVDGREVAKVIDFGIARALDGPLLAESGYTQELILGSPPYISPEAMTVAGRRNLDTRTDVYSLGLLLYELLAGVLPFDAKGQSVWSLMRQLNNEALLPPSKRLAGLDPARQRERAKLRRTTPRRLIWTLAGDLDAIVLKAIDRDPDRRYGSPADLASDLRRYLGHRPVKARPPSFAYHAARFLRRNAGSALAITSLLAVLATGLISRTIEARRANTEAARARQALAESEEVRRFMIELFETADPERAAGRKVTVRELLDQGAQRLRDELVDQPLARARFLQTIGSIYVNLGELRDATSLISEALHIRREHWPAGHPEVIESENMLGVAFRRQGRYDEAEPLVLAVLAARQNDPDVDPELLAEVQSNLGNVYWNQRRYDKAENAHRAALAIRERIRASEDSAAARTNEAISVNNLAVLLLSTSRLSEARPLLRRAIEVFREEEHPFHAAALNNLGLVERGLVSWAGAEAMFREALQRWEATYGVDHGRPINARRNLVLELARRHQYDEAIQLARETVAVAERIDAPSTHYEVLRLQGSVERDAGRFGDAIETLRRALAVAESVEAPDAPSTLRIKRVLASAIARAGDVDTGLAMLGEVRAAQQEQHASARDRLSTEDYFGYVLFWAGRYADSEPHFRRYVEGKIEEYDENHTSVGYGSFYTGRTLARLGQLDEAKAMFERALDIRATRWGDSHPNVADTVYELGLVEHRLGNSERARALLQQAVASYEAIYPAADPDLADARKALARVGS